MKKTVVLAEKPSVGRDIAKVLGCNQKGNGFFEGQQYIVTWALGHLVTLADPEMYDDRYKAWKMEDLPMLPKHLKLIVIKKTNKQFQAVKTQLLRKDVEEIIIATDAGREGELVARWILEKAAVKKPIKRLWISSVTDQAIKQGFRNLKDGKAYENLYASAQARAEADWLVGINATRALTTKYNAQLSCGRVQTPTLTMIAKREQEIKEFTPKKFYGVKVTGENGLSLTWKEAKSNEARTFNEEQANEIYNKIRNQHAVIENVQKSRKKSYAPSLYDLTELQRDCNRIFGYSAKETLSITQRLYEQYKVVTYPRTDSKYLTTDMIGTLKERLEAVSIKPYAAFATKILRQPIKTNKSFVDNSKVSDHHAIVPTEQHAFLQSMSDKEVKVYDLIVKRFLAVFMPAFEFEQTNISAKIGNETFTAKGQTIVNKGWKEIFERDENDESYVPLVKEGETLKITSSMVTNGETKPPEPFNEGTLLSAMENPVKFMSGESKDLMKTIGETGGLGTVATRADIIEKLFNSFLIEKRGKAIYMTSKGKQLLELVPEELKSPALTAQWEQKLTAISKGQLSKTAFVNDMKDYAKKAVQTVKNSTEKFKHDNISTKSCPDCGKPMLEVNGKKGKMLVCQDRECGHRKRVSTVTNARCPVCHKKLELRGEGEGQIFVCKCGHREKLSAFQNRKKNSSGKAANKRDVSQYMKKNNKEEPINTALADALAKLKFDK